MAAANEHGMEEGPDVGLQRAADEVREHLVCLRGRGLFLSSADSLLLVQWLESGIDVPSILRALERAAEARRKRRARVPLRLGHAKRHLGKPTAGVFRATPVPSSPDRPLTPVVQAIGTRHGGGSDALLQLERALQAVGPADAETLFRTAAAAARSFLDARWAELDASMRDRLRAQAVEALGDLVDMVDEETLTALVDEGARDQLRAGYPALSAASLWEVAEAGAADGGEGS